MSIEANKKVVLAYMERTGAGDAAGAGNLVHDDARIWFGGLGLVSKQEMLDVWVGTKRLKVDGDVQILNVTAEENRVALEWTGNTLRKDGTRYGNVYHILFFVEDGKITEMREYCDTAYLNHVFPGRVPARELALRPTSDERWYEITKIVAAKKAQLVALAAETA